MEIQIGQLGRLTGVEPGTLRAWERRYGIPTPARSAGQQRLYDPAQVAVVQRMAGLIQAGLRPRDAAKAAVEPGSTAAADPLLRDRLLQLLCAGDPAALKLLEETCRQRTIEGVLIETVMPILHEIGEAWARDERSVAEEHAASALVSMWLGTQIALAAPALHGTHVATACPAGENHEIPLLAFALLLRRQGVRVTHLGSDLPAPHLGKALRQLGPDALCLSASTAAARIGLNQAVDQAGQTGVAVFVGGSWAQRSWRHHGNVLVLPADLQEAARVLLEKLVSRAPGLGAEVAGC